MASTDTSTPLMEGAVEEELGRSWKWIMGLGVINIVGGFICLLAPVTVTVIAEQVISFTLIAVGGSNVTMGCFARDVLKAYYLALGAVQFAIGIIMFMNPFETLAVLTFIIAFAILFDGLYHVVMCFQSNRSESGWGLKCASGFASIAMGVIVLTGFPETSLYVIGIMLGVNMITIGNVRIFLAWEGRSIASQPVTEDTPIV